MGNATKQELAHTLRAQGLPVHAVKDFIQHAHGVDQLETAVLYWQYESGPLRTHLLPGELQNHLGR